ncbi:hypothetical protein RRF57_001580 [Xylaria bambusicola]|uniref:Uncharacterized protein n=1 Tax=Xylaria bambusicola TaxID=326684 RepID=A0AAN7UR24_9PEZI
MPNNAVMSGDNRRDVILNASTRIDHSRMTPVQDDPLFARPVRIFMQASKDVSATAQAAVEVLI